MGINTSAMIVVGYTYDETKEIYDKYIDGLTLDDYISDFYDWREDNHLESISPYYDADYDNSLFGTTVLSSGDYSYELLDIDEQKIKDITKEMTEQFGIEPKVYLTPYVS